MYSGVLSEVNIYIKRISIIGRSIELQFDELYPPKTFRKFVCRVITRCRPPTLFEKGLAKSPQ